MQGETRIVAVPSAADAWTAVGADFVVPAGAQRIVKVMLGISPDFGDPSGVRFAPVFRLIGSGLKEQSPHEYLGSFGNVAAETTSGATTVEPDVQIYEVDIPVQTGGSITAQVNTLDEAVTAGTCSVGLVYDNNPTVRKNSMSQYVDVAMTTSADAWTTIGTITVPRPAEGVAPTKIRELAFGIATDQATLALLRTHARFRLSGSGIAEGGSHEFIGVTNGTGAVTAGVIGYSNQMRRAYIDIPVVAGGQILVEHIIDVETPTAGTAALGVVYE